MSVGLHSVGTFPVGSDRLESTVVNTAINPGAGSVVITGYAPTLTQTANLALTPTQGSVVITGFAPSVSQSSGSSVNLTPAAGTLSVTGYSPTLTQSTNQAISPNAGGVTITGFAPSIVQTGGTPAPAGDGGGAGNIRDVRRFAELLSKPLTKAQKKKRRKILETVALDLLPDDPESKIVAEVIAKKVAQEELQVLSRWTPPKAMMLVSKPKPEYDPTEEIRALVAEWLVKAAIEREIEDEEDIEMLLLG